MKHLITLSFLIITITYSTAQKLEYPICPKQTVVDTFFNEYTVTENYRWLENVRCDSVIEWIEAENKISRQYLKKASAKFSCKTLLEKYGYVESQRSIKKGKYYFRMLRKNKQS